MSRTGDTLSISDKVTVSVIKKTTQIDKDKAEFQRKRLENPKPPKDNSRKLKQIKIAEQKLLNAKNAVKRHQRIVDEMKSSGKQDLQCCKEEKRLLKNAKQRITNTTKQITEVRKRRWL